MVNDNYYPCIGGVAEHIHHLSAELHRRGHKVTVLTAGIGSRAPTPALEPPEIVRIGMGIPVPANQSWTRMAIAWRPVHSIRKLLRKRQFDIVHIHGSLAPTLPLAAIKAAAITRPQPATVMTFHAGHDVSLGYSFARSVLWPYFRALDAIIAVSRVARDSHRRYFPGNYRIIPNGVDTAVFRPDAPPAPGFEPGRPRILFIGRFDRRKGLRHLLDALPLILHRFPDAELVVAGAPSTPLSRWPRAARSLQSRIRWLGRVPAELRPGLLTASSLLCAPSTGSESFGIVLLEAMAAGRPVVASNIPGYRTVIQDGVQGFLVPPANPAAIADRICELLANPSLGAQFGRAGRERALRFSWPAIADRIEKLYQQLSGPRSVSASY